MLKKKIFFFWFKVMLAILLGNIYSPFLAKICVHALYTYTHTQSCPLILLTTFHFLIKTDGRQKYKVSHRLYTRHDAISYYKLLNSSSPLREW